MKKQDKMHHISDITQYVILTRFDKTDVQTFQNQIFHYMFIFLVILKVRKNNGLSCYVVFVRFLRAICWIFRKIIKFIDDKRTFLQEL